MRNLAGEFRDFLIKGNLIQLAVAFIMGAVFAALLKAFIADLITPIIALIAGKPSFANLTFTINNSHFLYGDFINSLITFIVTGLAVFFFIVKPYARFHKTEDPATKSCPECTSPIPMAARRCPLCTAQIV